MDLEKAYSVFKPITLTCAAREVTLTQQQRNVWSGGKQTKRGWFAFVLWLFMETSAGIVREDLAEIKREGIMEKLTSNNRTSAIIGLLLAMPLAVLLMITVYDIAPLSGLYKTLTTEADGHRINGPGRAFEIGALLLLALGFIVTVVPFVRNVRSGSRSTASPINLLIVAALFIFIATLVIAFVIDQYPCWTGVPNCD